MLIELRIRNFAIIESLALALAPGLNVLTGETGAGKSIIAGALGVLLGERASTDLIRTGADRATVEGVFDVGGRPDLRGRLDEMGVDADDATLVLRREIAATGRTRAWINSAATTATVLASVGRELVTLHGQHEAQMLLDQDAQRAILDEFGGATEAAAAVRKAHESLTAVEREISSLEQRRQEAERRADYLRHVAEEIEAARLLPGEDAQVEQEARRLEHADELRTAAQGIAHALDGSDDAVLARLGAVQRALAAIQRIDPALERVQELYDSGYYALEELARAAAEYSEGVDLDPGRLASVQQRRDLIHRLTKKYGPDLESVMEEGRRARAELDLVDTAGLDLRQLRERRERDSERLAALARALSEQRMVAAGRLARAVDALLPPLGMPDGRFTVALVPRRETGPVGAEDVEFRVTLNVGHEARPLDRVASGGELSRVMLALEANLARLGRVPTLVFDEVDAGIGGRVGLQVGDAMRALAMEHQVLAITHLAQIAARAHHHVVVAKGAEGGITTAGTRTVEGEARIGELARLLGGDPERAVSRAHARELLASADAGERRALALEVEDGDAVTPAPSTRRRARSSARLPRGNR